MLSKVRKRCLGAGAVEMSSQAWARRRCEQRNAASSRAGDGRAHSGRASSTHSKSAEPVSKLTLYDKPSNSKPQPHLQAQTRPKPRRLHWRHKSGICRIKEDDLRCPFSSGSSRRAHAPCKDERSRQCAESRTFDLILYHRTLRRTALSAYVFGCK